MLLEEEEEDSVSHDESVYHPMSAIQEEQGFDTDRDIENLGFHIKPEVDWDPSSKSFSPMKKGVCARAACA